MEAIILAGGLGTRLQGVIGAYPKCMAAVNGKPFIEYLLTYLSQHGCKRVILSLGFKHEVVTEWLSAQKFSFETDHVIEYEPLGTGGGIKLALEAAREPEVMVLNGDTLFDIDVKLLIQAHREAGAETTIALREMERFERYGVVHTDAHGLIQSFAEKRYTEQGMINGGVYLIDRVAFLKRELPQKFSFEKDYLEKYVSEHKFYGRASSDYFIDIGVPEDYARVQDDFKTMFP
jgi:D-glycero-alpha-D-manno-heptose 1-phosphate guanylyltransferase